VGQTGSTSSCGADDQLWQKAWEWRVDGLLSAGRTPDVKPSVASWAPNRLDVWGYHLHVLALQRRPQPVPCVSRATMAWKRSGFEPPKLS
jgi:hypothetical protein